MNKKLTKIVGVTLGLSMAVGVGAGIAFGNPKANPVYAEELSETFTYESQTGTYLSYSLAQNGGANAPNTNSDIRIYNKNTLTFTANDYYLSSIAITSVEITGKNSKSGNTQTVYYDPVGGTKVTSGSNITWGTATTSQTRTATFTGNNLTSVVFYQGGPNNVQISSVTVYFTYTPSDPVEPIQLTAPTNLSANDTVLSWTNVEHNNGYSYSINTTPEATVGNLSKDAISFDASSLGLTAGTYSFVLKAKGDGVNYLDSEYCSSVSFTVFNYSIDVFDVSDFPATGTSYVAFSLDGSSGAKYVGHTAKNSSNIQLNNNGTPKSRSIGTSETCGYIRKVGVSWGNANGNTITVYVSNTPYSGEANLNTGTAQLTTLGSSNTVVNISGDYKYVSLFPSGATYPASISFYWEQVTFDQNLSSSSASAYANETITVSSDATNPVTWSIVSGAGTTAAGAAITSEGVISVSGAGTVTAKAVANSYNDSTIQVTFTEPPANIFEVTFNSNGGSESPAIKNIGEGNTFEFPSAGTKEHYTFDGWTSTGSAPYYAAGSTSPAVTEDIAYIAHWTEDAKYTVTYNAGANGNGSYAHTNNYGGTYTLLAFDQLSGISAADGYQIKDYTVDGVSKNPGDTFTLVSAKTVTVNFETIPPHDVLNNTVVPADAVGNTTSSWGTASEFSDSTGAVYTARFMGVSDANAFIGRLNDSTNGYIYTSTIPNGMKLRSVSITSMTASKTVGVYAQEDAYTGAPSDKSEALGTITPTNLTYYFGSGTHYRAICLRGHSTATEIGTVTITYAPLTEKDKIELSVQTLSALKFNYEDTIVDVNSYSNAAIRFGGLISKTQWDALDSESDIEGYGILVAANEDLGGKTIKQRYAAAKTNENTPEEAIASICGTYSVGKKIVNIPDDKANPADATAEQKAFMGVSGDYYIWTVKKEIGNNFTTKYNAVAFILIDGNIVFLREVSLSAKDIATSVIPQTEAEDPALPALTWMKDH